jgi:hypothetical protein
LKENEGIPIPSPTMLHTLTKDRSQATLKGSIGTASRLLNSFVINILRLMVRSYEASDYQQNSILNTRSSEA